MKIKSLITELPKAPDMSNPVDFDKEADIFVKALVPFSKDLNVFIREANLLSAFVNDLSVELKNYTRLALNQIESKSNTNILKIEKFCKDFAAFLEQKSQERLRTFCDECIQAVEAKGYEMIQRLNDNAKGADYIAISQSLAHSLSLERFIMQRGFIRLREEEPLNLDDVSQSLNEQNRLNKLSLKALSNISTALSQQNQINSLLKGENNE